MSNLRVINKSTGFPGTLCSKHADDQYWLDGFSSGECFKCRPTMSDLQDLSTLDEGRPVCLIPNEEQYTDWKVYQ